MLASRAILPIVGDGLDGADDVRPVGHGDEVRLGRNGFFDVGRVNHSGGGGEVDAREGDEFGCRPWLGGDAKRSCVRGWW